MAELDQDQKKAFAKLKRQATEIAGSIHDIVEDSLWVDYTLLPDLSAQLVEACQKVADFQKA